MKSRHLQIRHTLAAMLCGLATLGTVPLLASGLHNDFSTNFVTVSDEHKGQFQPARPFFTLPRLGLSLQIEQTVRLPSGNIITQGPAWSAESLAATRISGVNGVPGFGVPSLRANWIPGRRPWQVSLSVSDLTRENLFTNLADLSMTDTNRLRLLPDRHWWLGLDRRF